MLPTMGLRTCQLGLRCDPPCGECEALATEAVTVEPTRYAMFDAMTFLRDLDDLISAAMKDVEPLTELHMVTIDPTPPADPKFIDDMTEADWKRGIAKVFDNYRLY